jgi:hypothetical protein
MAHETPALLNFEMGIGKDDLTRDQIIKKPMC